MTTRSHNLTPLLIARSQLLMAVELFFEERDPISVHTLAGAAREMLESLCRIEGIEPMTDFILKDHPDKSQKDIWAAMNLYRNCFKHVGRTQDERTKDLETLDQFKESNNEFLLYVCVEDYIRLRGAMPLEFQVLQAWFAALHLDLLTDASKSEPFRRAFPDLGQQSRAEQKRRAREMLANAKNDKELTSDPRTEPRDLSGQGPE